MSAAYAYASGSDSDSDSDDAPEVVSLSTAKSARQEQERAAKQAAEAANKAKREKNRAKDKRAKAAKGKGKARQDEDEVDEEDEDEEAVDEELAEELVEDDEATAGEDAPPLVGKKTTYLDDSLFAEAAAHYDAAAQAGQPQPGEVGKKAAKRLVKEEKRRKREALERREAEVGAGGQTQVGDITLQHLPGLSHGPASLTSTALPSHTSATKFLTNRLYSKKRQVAVLDAGRPAGDKGKKQKTIGGMSYESRVLLGLEEPEPESKKKDKERRRKRSLLLQAEGQRKSAPSARPIASARRGAKPAANFAASTFRG
ncbi:hypothetical protein JCM10207_002935 [Rhodosporidiobolus poonsookiae]